MPIGCVSHAGCRSERFFFLETTFWHAALAPQRKACRLAQHDPRVSTAAMMMTARRALAQLIAEAAIHAAVSTAAIEIKATKSAAGM